jgi:hypothetical protein
VNAKKLNEAYTSGMFIIENYLTTLHCGSWVLDTKSGFHICNFMCYPFLIPYTKNEKIQKKTKKYIRKKIKNNSSEKRMPEHPEHDQKMVKEVQK